MGKCWSLDSRHRFGSFVYQNRSFPWFFGTLIIEFLSDFICIFASYVVFEDGADFLAFE